MTIQRFEGQIARLEFRSGRTRGLQPGASLTRHPYDPDLARRNENGGLAFPEE
jgi:hypothetical protein